MSVNPTGVFSAWFNEIDKLPYKVYRSEIPEDDALEYDARGTMKPFIVVEFGGPVRSARDHGIVSVRYDSHVVFLTVTAYAAKAADAEAIKGLFIDRLLGLKVDDTTELQLGGGMAYSRSSNTIRPTQFWPHSLSKQSLISLTTPHRLWYNGAHETF